MNLDVQPAGAWSGVARAVKEDAPSFHKESFRRDLLNVCIAVPWLAALYTTLVLLVTHQMRSAAVVGAVAVVLTAVLAVTWWPALPKPGTQELRR
jgi:hypothetical protein